MIATKYFLSVDWGSTNFRLRVVEYGSLKIITESFLQDGGVKNLFDHWKKKGGNRRSFFLNFLKSQIDQLGIKKLQGAPVIISGMASSAMGIMELPYAILPFSTSGENAVVKHIKSSDAFDFNIFLISGIKSEMDVIRGEETQLIGCIKEGRTKAEDQLFIFPGTHAKHILVRGNQVIDFKTYMTGEFFELLTTKSVLSNSVEAGKKPSVTKIRNSFERGLKAGIHGNLLNEAFYVRTNYLFKKFSKKNNLYYLSGLLIGKEIQDLPGKSYDHIVVVCGSALHVYYKLAFQMLGLSGNIKIISPRASDELVIKGQFKLLKNNIKIKW